jgi:hypothetical protein
MTAEQLDGLLSWMAGRLDSWMTSLLLLIQIFLLLSLSLYVADFDCPTCQCRGAVVKLKCEQELVRDKKDFEANFKKRKEKAKKDSGKKPRKTGSPLMMYACTCHTMRTLCGDVTSTTCTECKVRGYIEVKDSCPVFKTCIMCKCDTSVFIYRDIERMTIQQVESEEAETREIVMAPSYGILQEVSLLLLQSKKVTMSS